MRASGENGARDARERALGALAHDLRTPLTAIVGYAELLRVRDDEETRREAPLRIREAAEQLLAVVDAAVGPSAGPPTPDAVRRVLVVDDDEVVRRLLAATLPVEGFEVVDARNGDDALALADEEAIDLVLLDWNMPRRSGDEVLRELKERRAELPVVVLTAEVTTSLRERADSLGADVFLTKPFSPLELLGTLERLLADR